MWNLIGLNSGLRLPLDSSQTGVVQVSIPGGDIIPSAIISGGDDVTPDAIPPGVLSVTTTVDHMENEVDEEIDATELASVSNPREDISISDGSTLLKMLTFFGFFPLLKSEIIPKTGKLHLIFKIRGFLNRK